MIRATLAFLSLVTLAGCEVVLGIDGEPAAKHSAAGGSSGVSGIDSGGAATRTAAGGSSGVSGIDGGGAATQPAAGGSSAGLGSDSEGGATQPGAGGSSADSEGGATQPGAGGSSTDSEGGATQPGAGGSSGVPGSDSEGGATQPGAGGSPSDTPHTCDPTSTTFGPALPVPGLNRALGLEQRISLTSDELTAYVSAGKMAWYDADLYVARRTNKTEPFGPYELLTDLSSNLPDLSLSVSDDGLFAMIDRESIWGYVIYSAHRDLVGDPFSTPKEVSFAVNPFADVEPTDPYGSFMPLGGAALYFHVNMGGIYRASLQGTDVGEAAELRELSALLEAKYPVVSADETVLYFASNYFARDQYSSSDIWMTSRASAADSFGPPVKVSSVNTAGDELPLWISPDGCRLYFRRSGVEDTLATFMAERPPL